MRQPELDALPRDSTVLLLPTGAIEQHGRHLPVDTDICNSHQICLRAARASAQPTIVLPPIWWGTSPHHMAFAGTISLSFETFSSLIVDICRSVHRHGFDRVLVVNGHGGNAANLAATGLRISDELGMFVGSVSYWGLIVDVLREIGTSEVGGMGHACEMETSIQLNLRPERVDMASATRHIARQLTSLSQSDFRATGPVSIPWDFTRDAVDGVSGDPTVATEGKGAAMVDAAVNRLLALVEEFRVAQLR